MTEVAHTARPQHYVRLATKPLAWVDESNVGRVAELVAERIYRNRRRTRAGSYVLVMGGARVVVLSEASASTEAAVRRHPSEVIGRYGCGALAACPTVDEIADDLREHLKT